jgi:hypothetical protein
VEVAEVFRNTLEVSELNLTEYASSGSKAESHAPLMLQDCVRAAFTVDVAGMKA